MPKSLSHVVILTEDFDGLLRFLTDVANFSEVSYYEATAHDVHEVFGWPAELGPARGAFVGDSPGAVDVVEIPTALRGAVRPGVRLLAAVNRDAAGAGEAATAAGFEVRGPLHTTAPTGVAMSLVEVMAGGVAFELVQFG
jgi:hypothetical protein